MNAKGIRGLLSKALVFVLLICMAVPNFAMATTMDNAEPNTSTDITQVDKSTPSDDNTNQQAESKLSGKKSSLAKSSTSTSSNLEDFITGGNIYIDGGKKKPLSGNVTIKENSKYKVELAFAEDPEGRQFATEMTYHLPESFLSVDHENNFNLTVSDGEKNYTIHADYTVKNGLLTVKFNKADNDEVAWDKFMASSNCEFIVTFEGGVKQNTEEIKWSGTTVTHVTIKDVPRDLKIKKTGSFDRNTGKINYNITVTSTGENTNIVITDKVDGSNIELISSGGVTAKPSKGALSSSVNEKGFEYRIPSMHDGETIVLTYQAIVTDYNTLTKYGTENQTKNSAAVYSNEHKDKVTANFNLNNKVSYTSIKKTPTINDKDSTVQWTIKYNTERLTSMGGRTIKDTIDEGSRMYMSYMDDASHAGVNMTVRDKDNKVVGEANTLIPWSQLNKTNSSWSYEIPETDKAYEYTFTYATKIDKSCFNVDTIVKNKVVDNHGIRGDGSAKIIIGDGNKIKVNKEVVSVTNGYIKDDGTVDSGKIDWKVTMTVPASGLNKAELFDTLPNHKFGTNTYYDEYIDGSLKVLNLENDETYDGPSYYKDDRSGFTITFFKNNDKTAPGLKGTGEPRQIILTYSTKTNADWLNNANDNYGRDDYDEHKNKVKFTADNGHVEDAATGKPVMKQLKKYFNGQSVGKDGTDVFLYGISVYGIDEDLDLYDEFDTSKLAYDSESDPEDPVHGKVARRIYSPDMNKSSSDALTITQTEKGLKIHIDKEKLPKHSNGSLYRHYNLYYVLKVKNADTLNDLRYEALKKEGSIAINNSVRGNGYGTAKRNGNFSYSPLTKDLLGVVEPEDGSRPYANYSITINKDALDLNPDGDTLKLTDTHSSTLSIDYNSIKIEPNVSVPYDASGNTVTYTIPDNTAITISYKAYVIGTGDVEIENEATLTPFTAYAPKQSIKLQDTGSGHASIHSINLLKYEAGDMTARLSGATFALYIKDNKTNEWSPVVNKAGEEVEFTTNDRGEARIFGHQDNDGWTLIKGREYSLLETKAPAGYLKDDTRYKFTIQNQPDYDNYVYMDGDLLRIKNKPILTDISVTKKWNDSNDQDGLRPNAITVKLLADGKEAETMVLNANNKWTGNFTGLKNFDKGKEIEYSVEEVNVDGYTSEITGDSSNGYTITNAHSPAVTAISGSKTWNDDNNRDGKRPESITVNLLADGNKVDSKVVTAEDDWAWNFDNLPKLDKGKEIIYTVVEENVEGYSTTYSEDGYDITNSYTPEETNVTVTKAWNDSNNQDGVRPKAITVKLLANGTEVQSMDLNADNKWTGNFTELKKFENGKEINYTVEEVKVDKYLTTISGSAASGYIITNSHTPTPSDGPKSGDNMNLFVLLMMLMASGCGALGCMAYRRYNLLHR